MAQLLGNVAVGSIVYLNENGSPQPFYVAKHDYESDLNGSGRTLVVRKDCYDRRQWHTSNANAYASSAIDNWLNSTYKNMLDADIRALIGSTKIHYTPGNGNTTMGTLDRAVFLLSAHELGKSESWFNKEGTTLPNATNYQIAKLNGSIVGQWTRSPYTHGTDLAIYLNINGGVNYQYCTGINGSRPAFTLPATMFVDNSNNIVTIPIISTLTVPFLAMQGQSIPISWTPVSLSGLDVTYQLQRNADNGGWTTIYTGADTSYTNTAGTWTQVQYQVAAVISEVSDVIGNYTQSSIIPVFDPSTLVISGSDGNLGTLTSNVPYTVSSNTGNPISLTRTVNDAQVVTLTVDSGFAYSIPIADLPTGTGTIVITAQVQDSGGEIVTATRTWTYYKTPINIPSTGGIAQLTQNGQNIWPVTVPDAVEAPVYLGGNLNAALNKLGQAALYTKIGVPIYNEVTINLANVSVGDEVLLPENGIMTPYIVVQIGNPDTSIYDNSCNGVWLLRKNITLDYYQPWDSNRTNNFSTSTIKSWLNSTMLLKFDSTIQNNIIEAKIPYGSGGGTTNVNIGENGTPSKIFLLSVYETGGNSSIYFAPQDGATLSYFIKGDTATARKKRIAYTESTSKAGDWWTRSPYSNNISADFIYTDGSFGALNAHDSDCIRPCFIMPTTFTATYYVDTENVVHSVQEYTQGGSITDVFGYDIPIAQSESGTYVGTGTTGASNPNSISLSFMPKFVCITNKTDSSKRAFLPYGGYGVCWTQNTATGTAINVYGIATTWTANGVSWYNNNVVQQMNESGDTYQYTAFA